MRKLLYEITHLTTYNYAGNVSVSHHLLHLSPRPTPQQTCFAPDLRVHPAPASLSSHTDYFGNLAHFVAVERTHHRLEITARSRVAIQPAYVPDAVETPSWESVANGCRTDHSRPSLEAHEFTYASPLVPLGPQFAAYAAPSFLPERPVLEAVQDLTRRIHQDFKFDPSATTVTTPVTDFYRLRRGVCQDFAQFQIACLRSLGLPARYVSGYLETDPPPGQTKLRGADASHAWISFFCPGWGWISLDPTNNCIPSLRHLTVGWGRDYSDVAPVRGVLMGGSGQVLSVSVDVVALGPTEHANRPE